MLNRVRGLKSLLHDAVDFTADLVEQGHESTARNVMGVLRLLAPDEVPVQRVEDVRRLLTSGALGSVRAVNRAIERLTDAGIDAALGTGLVPGPATKRTAVPMRSGITGSAAWIADATVGALNGVAGDYLHREQNGLDLGFSLRHGEDYLAMDGPLSLPASPRLALFVHGLLTTEWSWCWDAEAYHGDAGANFGTLLHRDLGITPVFARYNTGRRVCDNGLLLAECLERLFEVRPDALGEVLLIGHSMGGLVARSACHQADRAGHAWVRRVSRVICLGSPHQGAPLEKFGHALTTVLSAIDHPGTRIPAEILRRRSAGIRDLRHGTIVDDAWLTKERDAGGTEVPLLDHIPYHFVSATVTRDQAHPLGWLIGDVLVRTPSALGPVLSEGAFRIETASFGGIVHHQLQNHPDVYAWLRRTCEGP